LYKTWFFAKNAFITIFTKDDVSRKAFNFKTVLLFLLL